ncbi:MAG: serine/threonine-protein kinase [Polyangiaceae bacterium]|nr:serine/threonine-protein kinase [Polyangiaceae bacterium]
MLRRGATGNTTASRLKALVLHAQAVHGRAAADALLREVRLDRVYLDDETRPLPISVWHAALEAFASRFGREAIRATLPGFVHPDNLGVWSRVLRGASEPLAAYQQLEALGGEDALTDGWRTDASAPGRWRGHVTLRQPSFELDGLCALAREAELAAVPLLFGLPPARVRARPGDPDRSGGAVLEYEVRWRARELWLAPALGGAVGVSAGGALALAAHAGEPRSAALTLTAAALGGVAGVVLGFERRRRAQARAQATRIEVLERSAALREARERGAASFEAGAVIAGQYRLGAPLGAGASGAIWEAERLGDGEVVAIKLLRTAVAHDTIAADRLRREAAALGLAWHENVVEIYDDGYLYDGTSFLVMERLYGEPLGARLRRSGPLAPAELQPIALQLCDALSAVHAAGVVHRDLKPSNIFLSRARDAAPEAPPVVKLLDFGIARVEWAETRLTNMGAPVGTPGYMSPEQEQGEELDGRADLYALGAVLYECLTGLPPPARALDPWPSFPPRGPEAAESGVQRALRAVAEPWRRVIGRALALRPAERYPDARALRKALEKLAVSDPELTKSSRSA